MKDLKRAIEILILWVFVSCRYFILGIKKRSLFSYLKNYFREALLHVEIFAKFIEEYKDFEELQSSKMDRLKHSSYGLHQLLGEKERFFYSLFIVIERSDLEQIKTSLNAALGLTAPNFEVLVGFTQKQSQEIEDYLRDLKNQIPHRLQLFSFNKDVTKSARINSMAQKAKGNYFFLLDQGDWIRPDLFYRYEQTLYFFPKQSHIVLFCDDYQIDEAFIPIPRTRSNKPEHPLFPYIFNDVLGNTLLIPKTLWEKMGGLNENSENMQAFDLPLRLEQAGAIFQKVPLHLYARLKLNKTDQENLYSSPSLSQKIINSLQDYSKSKKLDWNWEKGYSPNSFRALPVLKDIPRVHVIILYKDQANKTLSAVHHLLKQVGVEVKITAVDNMSTDISLGNKLKQLNVEVIRVDEPFNYSRLNNLAIQKSSQNCENILFLNNDVDLERNALLEMCRWIDQPHIGMVGCRLNYPNGLLQHGGVIIESSRAAFIKSWHHIERTEKFSRLESTNFLRISAAVTAACCLIKRKTFLEVDGFDATWFPVAFSDTALAIKLRAKGLHCLYTPFAFGVHHESLSRKKSNIEDYESLTWTHRKFVQNLWKDEKIHFKDLTNTEY